MANRLQNVWDQLRVGKSLVRPVASAIGSDIADYFRNVDTYNPVKIVANRWRGNEIARLEKEIATLEHGYEKRSDALRKNRLRQAELVGALEHTTGLNEHVLFAQDGQFSDAAQATIDAYQDVLHAFDQFEPDDDTFIARFPPLMELFAGHVDAGAHMGFNTLQYGSLLMESATAMHDAHTEGVSAQDYLNAQEAIYASLPEIIADVTAGRTHVVGLDQPQLSLVETVASYTEPEYMSAATSIAEAIGAATPQEAETLARYLSQEGAVSSFVSNLQENEEGNLEYIVSGPREGQTTSSAEPGHYTADTTHWLEHIHDTDVTVSRPDLGGLVTHQAYRQLDLGPTNNTLKDEGVYFVRGEGSTPQRLAGTMMIDLDALSPAQQANIELYMNGARYEEVEKVFVKGGDFYVPVQDGFAQLI